MNWPEHRTAPAPGTGGIRESGGRPGFARRACAYLKLASFIAGTVVAAFLFPMSSDAALVSDIQDPAGQEANGIGLLNNGQDLDWSVYTSVLISDFDPGKPGQDVLWLSYTVRNLSPPGAANSLVVFEVGAGSRHGVYFADSSIGNWVAEIFEDSTRFVGNGSYIAPGSSAGFSIVSDNLATADGTAHALADGGGFPKPFPARSIIVPVPEPGTSVFVFVVAAYVLVKRPRKDASSVSVSGCG